MKKVILIAAAAFAVSTAGGVGGRILLAPARGGAAATPEAAADGPPKLPKEAVKAAIAEASEIATAGDPETANPAASPKPSPPKAAPAHAARSADPAGMEFQEMARILSSMNPDEAAIFISHLDASQGLGILRSMTVRDAVVILGRLPDDRADALRKRLLDFTAEAR
jgi:hypothetical protein